MSHRGVQLPLVVVALASVLLLTSGCGPTGSDSETVSPTSTLAPMLEEYPDIDVIENVQYGTADGEALLLDVCLPNDNIADTSTDAPSTDDTSTAAPSTATSSTDSSSTDSSSTATPSTESTTLKARAAIVSIHGGSWAYGDKSSANWRSVCTWLASEGYVAVSVNYRLAPTSTSPAQLQDVRAAVRWLREDAQVEEYTIDPTLIGAFGGSAGGNLAALLGTTGSGALDTGSRVAAVAELSGPTDVTDAGRELGGLIESFEELELDYLGCTSLASCPTARAASPLYQVDESDPPFFVGHSADERIPLEQSEAFVEELRANGIDTTFVTVEGSRHSIAMLDSDMRDRIAEFFAAELTNEPVSVVP